MGGCARITSVGKLLLSLWWMAITFGQVGMLSRLAGKTLLLQSFQGCVAPCQVNFFLMGLYPSPVFLIKSIPNVAGSVRC